MTIAFWCILAAGILPQLTGIFAKASTDYDNEQPRDFLAAQQGAKSRANAAMQNGYEGLALFVGAVIIAHILQADQAKVDMLALGYIAARVVYNIVYIKGLGTIRSIVWMMGIACIVGLFVIAA